VHKTTAVHAGQYLSMISETQYYVVSVGEDVSMECSFHADRYDMFDNPVLWRKQQLDEFSQINILGSINDPFISTNRYEVTFDAAKPRYQIQLHISGQVTDADTSARWGSGAAGLKG